MDKLVKIDNENKMKKFTIEEIKGLLNQVYREEISFSRMVEVINQRLSERMSETSEPQYKDGDFVYEDGRIMIVKSYPCTFHANAWPIFSDTISYNGTYAVNFSEPTFRYATAEEKQELIELLKKDGKQWNEEKKCVEDIPTELKEGDFVVGFGCVFILHTQIDEYSAQYHVLYAKTNWNLYYYRTYSLLGNTDKLRLATESEKQELLDALAKKGKIWNAEKLCIDNIQVRKFKIGDKVRIKHGVSSKTHDSIRPYFAYSMDELIGKVLTVEYCDNSEIIICDGYAFLKEWLEPYEELKKGDLAIFWDKVKRHAIITFYERSDEDETCLLHKDIAGSGWENAIKFESKEQYERFIKGEI